MTTASLLERSTPTSITLIDIEGKEKTYAISGFKPNSDGDIVISRSVWEKTIPNLNGVRVNFSGFDSSVTKDDGCYIDIKGTPDLTGKRTITGIWQTDYSPDSGMTNVKDTDPGSITVEAINPYISATAGWYDKDDALQPNTSVPYLWEDSFYEFVFENRSESASTETNLDFTLSVKDVDNTAGTTLKGFVPDEIIISADWAEAADIEAVHFYNYGQTFDDTPALSINWADAVAKYKDPSTGEIRIPVKDFSEVTNLLRIRLECSHFNGNVYNKTNPSQPDLDNALHVTIHGTPEWHDALWASASFEPQSPLYEDATADASTYLDIEDFDPLVTGVSHGSPVTADDVIASYSTYLDKQRLIAGQTGAAGSIEGAEEYMSGSEETITGLEKVDDKTLRFTFVGVSPSNLDALSVPVLKTVQGEGYPAGAGAYAIKSVVNRQEIVLEKREGAASEYPYDEVVLKRVTTDSLETALQDGFIDLFFTSSEQTLQQAEECGYMTAYELPGTDYSFIGIRTDIEPLNNVEARRAVIQSVDRAKLADIAYESGTTLCACLAVHGAEATILPFCRMILRRRKTL